MPKCNICDDTGYVPDWSKDATENPQTCTSCHGRNTLTLNEYQERAAVTQLPECESLDYLLPGLVSEVGELMGKIAKRVRGDADVTDAMFIGELGDILWMVAMIAKAKRLELGDIAQDNLDKLAKRKVDGTIRGSGDER